MTAGAVVLDQLITIYPIHAQRLCKPVDPAGYQYACCTCSRSLVKYLMQGSNDIIQTRVSYHNQ